MSPLMEIDKQVIIRRFQMHRLEILNQNFEIH